MTEKAAEKYEMRQPRYFVEDTGRSIVVRDSYSPSLVPLHYGNLKDAEAGCLALNRKCK